MSRPLVHYEDKGNSLFDQLLRLQPNSLVLDKLAKYIGKVLIISEGNPLSCLEKNSRLHPNRQNSRQVKLADWGISFVL
jgi:hypothetical protein